MKPKDLLFSLDHVGDDLLAEAEQTVLARRSRPWARAVAAAAALVILGAGGFLLWRALPAGISPAGPGGSEDPGALTEPAPPLTEPDRLSLGDSWTGVSRVRFDDPETSLAGSFASDYSGLSSLPVYERESGATGDPSYRYTDDALVRRLYEAAARIGAAADDGYDCSFAETDGGTMDPVSCSCETEQGRLTVYADGRILMLYNEEYAYEAQVKLSLAGELTPAETERAIRDARMQECGEKLAQRLGLGECGFVTCEHWEPASSAWTVFTIYPVREDPAAQLTARWFESVRMLTNDGKTLRGFELDRLPGETGAGAPEGLRLLGSFPIRSAQEAFADYLEGRGLCEEEPVSTDLNGFSPVETLVYLPEAGHELLMPFYRFWTFTGSEEYLAVYVPALTDACLEDWPAQTDAPEPAEPTDDTPDTTEPPDGYQPMPVLQSDGQYEIAGPAGSVEALHYMGFACQDPVWADLDGDGFRELVYWCNGPTSGLFTVAICVYGLEKGWPVLEASQIYSLTHGDVSLSEEEGSVFLHWAGYSFVSEEIAALPGTEQSCSVAVKEGEIVLNGGQLPEGVQAWGSPAYGWLSASFDELKAEVTDSCTLNHWAALVWTAPSAASVPTAGPDVYAAVTGNGMTVTGLLHYVPQQDGSWYCLSQGGIGPIETPADPEALVGLTPEELTERLGPCHFDLGSGLYIPCWFTEDCRLLVIHMQDTAIRVELKDLTEPVY